MHDNKYPQIEIVTKKKGVLSEKEFKLDSILSTIEPLKTSSIEFWSSAAPESRIGQFPQTASGDKINFDHFKPERTSDVHDEKFCLVRCRVRLRRSLQVSLYRVKYLSRCV